MNDQQPQQPGWGAQQAAPQPPKKPGKGKKIAGAIVGAFLALIVIGAVAGGGEDTPTGKSDTTAADKKEDKPAGDGEPAAEKKEDKPEPKEDAPAEVVFKVWGDAPSGVDITYGSDTENIQGSGLPMEKTLKLKDDALYYSITAQLSGGGDIRCSVTINGETKEGHAVGGYNICSAQLNSGLLGGWE